MIRQQSKVTLKELMLSVRELIFDRFIIPCFVLKSYDDEDVSLSIDKGTGTFRIVRTTVDDTGETVEETLFIASFNDVLSMEDLVNALLEEGIVFAYSPYFRGTESIKSLLTVTKKTLDEDTTVFRRYFFSDNEITDMIRRYYYEVLCSFPGEITDDLIGLLQRPSQDHMAIWVAYWLVDKRRLYENAAGAVGTSFTDGSDYTCSDDSGSAKVTTVQIGSVFSITNDPNTGYFYDDYNRVGSDNVWGDRYSFWYRLQLYLRGMLEERFGDYRLRKDEVIPGRVELIRELDFRSYYDSYPFTLSPLSRGILSKTT